MEQRAFAADYAFSSVRMYLLDKRRREALTDVAHKGLDFRERRLVELRDLVGPAAASTIMRSASSPLALQSFALEPLSPERPYRNPSLEDLERHYVRSRRSQATWSTKKKWRL
mmetsp:Transcript_83751/g.233595  ORF Transcript_83751/g.233595 Transcript_83751/m.233595 type:complete len:113 (-) Transcript_83751:150-488(-)